MTTLSSTYNYYYYYFFFLKKKASSTNSLDENSPPPYQTKLSTGFSQQYGPTSSGNELVVNAGGGGGERGTVMEQQTRTGRAISMCVRPADVLKADTRHSYYLPSFQLMLPAQLQQQWNLQFEIQQQIRQQQLMQYTNNKASKKLFWGIPKQDTWLPIAMIARNDWSGDHIKTTLFIKVWLFVLQFLDQKTKLCSVQLVNREFRCLTMAPQLWSLIDLPIGKFHLSAPDSRIRSNTNPLGGMLDIISNQGMFTFVRMFADKNKKRDSSPSNANSQKGRGKNEENDESKTDMQHCTNTLRVQVKPSVTKDDIGLYRKILEIARMPTELWLIYDNQSQPKKHNLTTTTTTTNTNTNTNTVNANANTTTLTSRAHEEKNKEPMDMSEFVKILDDLTQRKWKQKMKKNLNKNYYNFKSIRIINGFVSANVLSDYLSHNTNVEVLCADIRPLDKTTDFHKHLPKNLKELWVPSNASQEWLIDCIKTSQLNHLRMIECFPRDHLLSSALDNSPLNPKPLNKSDAVHSGDIAKQYEPMCMDGKILSVISKQCPLVEYIGLECKVHESLNEGLYDVWKRCPFIGSVSLRFIPDFQTHGTDNVLSNDMFRKFVNLKISLLQTLENAIRNGLIKGYSGMNTSSSSNYCKYQITFRTKSLLSLNDKEKET
ncbi:hypothetical protein RFI_10891 [Reticulomyxa filosa]|uniref:Uncharacterized protein n=1 Tax=Reticulomyxa filosa TaxID=46433 RepID=X6NK08_RETFI|nr:hypothetical protein RFI_10891 [Reticulomyxa filosa]|eukprot:ETO26248.1 hypothetical protein RFI_10891 [Reticulomyxa filosa]